MKKILYILAAVAIVNTTFAQKIDRSKRPEAGAAPKIKIGQYEKFELANGLKVFVIENHKLPTVSFSLTIDKDPLLEKDKVGLSSMAGDLMSAGTSNRTKDQIDEEIDFMGANFTSYSSGFFASSLKKHADKLLNIATDVLYNPTFPQEELDKMKKRSISSIKAAKTSPDAMISNVSSVLNFGANHPYGEVQTLEHLENITIDDCKKYFNTYFRPNVSYLVIVGDITVAEAKKMVEKYFAQWEKADVPSHKYSTPQKPAQTEVAFINKPGAVQSVIEITYPLELKPGSDDAITASVMNSILGGGVFSGRLMQNLREGKAYTYGARSSLNSDLLVGSFSAGASVRNAVSDSAVYEFMYELRRMLTEKVTAEELDLVKKSMNGSFARSLESPQTIARFALNIERYGLPKDYYDTYLEKLSAITIDDIQRVAQKYIHPENAHIIVVGNKGEVANKLAQFSTSGKVNFYDANGVLQVEDVVKKELPKGLTAQKVVDDYVFAVTKTSNTKQLNKKLKSTKSINTKMSGEIQGFSLTMTRLQAQGKFYEAIEAMGQTFQKKVFDGKKGYQTNMMTGKGDLEGDELEDAKRSANYFPETTYAKDYTLNLVGIESFSGSDCYVVEVTSKKGNKTTEYYDIASKMKVYSAAEVDTPEGKFTTETEFSEYKEVGGFMFPHKTTVTSGEQTFEFAVSSIEVNGKIDTNLFK